MVNQQEFLATLDEHGDTAFPYTIGSTFYGTPSNGTHATIPATGVTTLAALAIAGFSPASGGSGSRIVITGKGFAGVKAVYFNEMAATGFSIDGDTQITATVPGGAAAGRVRIDRADAYARSTTDFLSPQPRRRAAGK